MNQLRLLLLLFPVSLFPDKIRKIEIYDIALYFWSFKYNCQNDTGSFFPILIFEVELETPKNIKWGVISHFHVPSLK